MEIYEDIGITAPELIDHIDHLLPYQKDALKRQIRDFETLNSSADSYTNDTCPKCHAVVNTFGRGGYTYRMHDGKRVRDKKLIKCPVCGKRFVPDHGQLTFYSHMDSDVWAQVIADTIDGVSLARTAARINRSETCVFHMRHKFLSFLEALDTETEVSKPSEADEKYIPECHKGLVKAEISDKTIVISREKEEPCQGISNQKVCLGTVVERSGRSYLQAFNNGKPGKEELEKICSHIKPGTFVWTDMLKGYDSVLRAQKCRHVGLKSGTDSFDQVNHLNTVNNLHSQISSWLRSYRNVSSIYINRYAALFALRQRYFGCDTQEIVLKVIRWLRGRRQYFYRKEESTRIYKDEYVMEKRKGLISTFRIKKMQDEEDYEVVYA